MTRTAIRYTLSTIAAIALVSAFGAGPASAQNNNLMMLALQTKVQNAATVSKDPPKGLATKKGEKPKSIRELEALRNIDQVAPPD